MKNHKKTAALLQSLALCLFASGTLSLGACDSTDPQSSETASPVADASETSCYQQVTGQGELQDLEVLRLTREGATIKGEYHWLPAQKDRRRGTFTGQQTASGISASYTYQQEGQTGTTDITLTPGPDSIVVAGGPPEMGLAATLPKIDCSQLKAPAAP